METISKIKLPDNSSYDIRALGIHYAQVDSTSTATKFTATIPGITEYYDGLMILLKNGVVTSESNFTIDINGLGAKGSYTNLAAATRDTSIFNISYTMLFIYDSTRVAGGCWICYRGYNAKIPTKTSELINDSGFITGYTETDPTVPSWAKNSTKPTYTATEVGALPNDTFIPTKTSDLINDTNFMSGMTILSYGHSTFDDFLTAYTAKHVVYCRASSGSNPASGSQTRMAFMAYVNNAENPTEVEFQYYRSVSSHTASQQGDQVYVYKLNKTGGWTVTVRESYTKIIAGTGMSSTYANSAITLNVDSQLPTVTATDNGKVLSVSNGAWAAVTPASDSAISATTIQAILNGTYS